MEELFSEKSIDKADESFHFFIWKQNNVDICRRSLINIPSPYTSAGTTYECFFSSHSFFFVTRRRARRIKIETRSSSCNRQSSSSAHFFVISFSFQMLELKNPKNKIRRHTSLNKLSWYEEIFSKNIFNSEVFHLQRLTTLNNIASCKYSVNELSKFSFTLSDHHKFPKLCVVKFYHQIGFFNLFTK